MQADSRYENDNVIVPIVNARKDIGVYKEDTNKI